jgi:hypothetical protein
MRCASKAEERIWQGSSLALITVALVLLSFCAAGFITSQMMSSDIIDTKNNWTLKRRIQILPVALKQRSHRRN